MATEVPPSSEPGRLAAGARLAICLAAIALCWLGLLPLAARNARVQAMIEHNEALGIDPSAKFYSELPAMPEIIDRVRAARRQEGQTFWRPSS